MNTSRLLFFGCLLSGTLILRADGCSKEENEPDLRTATYNINSDTLSSTAAVIRTDSTFESDCQNNNKIFVIVNPQISTHTGPLIVVNYNQPTLAVNEIKIDIADGVGTDYLSTGDTTATGGVPVTAYYTTDYNHFTLSFGNVPLRQYGSNGPTTTVIRSTGFLSKN